MIGRIFANIIYLLRYKTIEILINSVDTFITVVSTEFINYILILYRQRQV